MTYALRACNGPHMNRNVSRPVRGQLPLLRIDRVETDIRSSWIEWDDAIARSRFGTKYITIDDYGDWVGLRRQANGDTQESEDSQGVGLQPGLADQSPRSTRAGAEAASLPKRMNRFSQVREWQSVAVT